MNPCLICYFIVILFYIEKKWLVMRNLATILPNCLENFSVLTLYMEVSKCWRVVEFPKISIKMKNCKIFYEAQRANRLKEVIKPLPYPLPAKSYYVSRTKIILPRYTTLYTHLIWKCFKNAVLGLQEMVQRKCFFWHQTGKCLLENL